MTGRAVAGRRIEVHLAWNTAQVEGAVLEAWSRDRPLAVLNPAAGRLPAVAAWLGELGFRGAEGAAGGRGSRLVAAAGTPILEGLAPGFHAILMTSGTTGRPRMVALDCESVCWNVKTLARHLGLPADGSLHVALQAPLFHAFGLVLCRLMATELGGSAHRFERFDPGALLGWLARGDEAAHHLLPFVPSMVRALPDPERIPPGTRDALARVRGTAIVGGDRVRAADLIRLRALLPGVRATIGYGLTEAGPALTHTLGEIPSFDGALGHPLPGVELEPDSADTGWRFLSPGQCAALREPGDPAWTPSRGRFLSTGDLLQDRGTEGLRFVGRRSWCFKRGGETVSPVLVEEAIRGALRAGGLPEEPSFVVAPDPDGVPVLVVEGPASAALDAELLRAAASVPTHFRPLRIHRVPGLPRNALGKIERGAIVVSRVGPRGAEASR